MFLLCKEGTEETPKKQVMNEPQRKHPRLPQFDYSAPNVYFLTLCTKNRRRCLAQIVGRGLDPAVRYTLELTPYGNIAEQDLLALPHHFEGVELLHYVVMPDHLHILLQLHPASAAGSRPRPTVPTLVGQYKAGVSRKCRCALWQTSYYDHVVRNEQELLEIWRYIDNNPLQWVLDGKV